jgi:hypothetical protein
LYRLWALLPVFNTMPYPHRHFMVFCFAASLLAGLGLDALRQPVGRRVRAWWLAPGLGYAAVLALVAWKGPGFAARTQPLLPPGIDLHAALALTNPALWLPVGLWALAAAALARVARGGTAWVAVAVLVLDLGLFSAHMGFQRLCPLGARLPGSFALEPYYGRYFPVPKEGYPYYGAYAGIAALELPCLSAMAGIRTVNGYDAFVYQRYHDLTTMDSGGTTADAGVWLPANRVFDVLGLRTLGLAPGLADTATWRARLAGGRWQPEGQDRWLDRQALPRAWRPAAWAALSPAEVDRRLVGAVPFDPLAQALVEAPIATPAIAPGPATVRSAGPNRMHLETDGPAPGLVVVSESYDPGWHAFLGERELPVHRADALILGVEVPAGRQAIELRYEPPRWRQGLAVGALALVGLLFWLVRRPR